MATEGTVQPVHPEPGPAAAGDASEEQALLSAIAGYLSPEDTAEVARVLRLVHTLRAQAAASAPARERLPGETLAPAPQDLTYVIAVARTLAGSLHIDAVTLAAVLLYQEVERGAIAAAEVRAELGGAFGEQVAKTISSIERFDMLQRPATTLRRTAQLHAEAEDAAPERKRARERQRRQDLDALRKMFVAMAEDPRVVVIKIADQLRLMRAVAQAADAWRAAATAPAAERPAPQWTLDECRLLAEETRELYAPLAARLGMGRVEADLEDLAFAVLEPEDYRWLREAVAEETSERRSYVDRVTAVLREEMAKLGIQAKVSGRVKHLYSIYLKVRRSESRDLSSLYDILAFRIIVESVEQCFLVLGQVHSLWRPKDGRFKDFIHAPKPNGYQSLHTTVFCLDNRLAEIQIRTQQMHELAEYGVAMHWYYKAAGDRAQATAAPLQTWMQHVKEWQQELQSHQGSAAQRTLDAVKRDVLHEQIYVFTPAGDAKELPAGSTPLDFAYRIHSDVGDHASGVRITADTGTGRLVKKLVPLDYELKSGDMVEIIKRNDAHPTRDWLRFVRTKAARDRITRYLKAHERDIDIGRGRERLDRELKAAGIRKGMDALSDEDLAWLAQQLTLADAESLLVAVALGSEQVRLSALLARVRERLQLPTTPEAAPEPEEQPAREARVGASVEGLEGMLTHLASCCNPLPGDPLRGFVTRGRGVVIHQRDCPNLRHLVERQPERAVEVAWPALTGKEIFRARIVVEGEDRTGLLRDVTGVISGHKLNMPRVNVVTRSRPDRAVIYAVVEIQRLEQLEHVLRDLRGVAGVLQVERIQPTKPGAASTAPRRRAAR